MIENEVSTWKMFEQATLKRKTCFFCKENLSKYKGLSICNDCERKLLDSESNVEWR